MMDTLIEYFRQFLSLIENMLDGMVNGLLWIPRYLYQSLINYVIETINDLNLYDFVGNINNVLKSIPENGAFFFDLFQIPFALTLFSSLIVFHFVWRRVPILGGK